jgi:hypothetical protein
MSRRTIKYTALVVLLFASLCVHAQTAAPPATAKVETKTGAITGRVVNENGGPHMNVDVWVRPDTPEGIPVTHTTTNREGVFKATGLTPGSYNVSVAVPAHLPKSPEAGPLVYKAGDLVTLVLTKGGVITGTVTNGKGDPVVGIGVRVHMVRDESGRDFAYAGRHFDGVTDDRGVYRVYGLPTGTYVVSADGSIEDRTPIRFNINGFANDLPTYAPSSNREDAAEFSVRLGEEVSDANIRYRGERGSTISGVVNGLTAANTGFGVILTSIIDRGPHWYNQFRSANGEFAIDAIPDGDYTLVAWTDGNNHTRRQSETLALHVRGADIEGLQLTPLPFASINGRVVLEALKTPPPECTEKRAPQFSELSVTAWYRVIEGAKKKPHFVWRAGVVTPNAEGKLAIANIPASEYYFALRFSTQQWFLRSIAFAPPNGQPADVTRTWTTVKPGDQLSDLTFTLAQGAGSVNGAISFAPGQTLPEKLVAFLVPAEPDKADDVLRYFAVPVNAEGRFYMYQVAAGRYWLFAGPGTDNTGSEVSKIRLPDGADARSSLRAAAEAAKQEIEIKPCQELTFRLPLTSQQ